MTLALIRIFGGEGLISLPYVKFCADSKNVNLIAQLITFLTYRPFLGPKFAFLVKNMISSTNFDGEF